MSRQNCHTNYIMTFLFIYNVIINHGAEKIGRQIYHGKVIQRQNLSATKHLRSKMSGRQDVDTKKLEVRDENAVSHTAKKFF